MTKLILIFILFGTPLLFSGSNISLKSDANIPLFTAQAGIDTISNRLCRKVLVEQVDELSVLKFMNSLQADGSWADINYNDPSITTWEPVLHLKRLKSMAMIFHKHGSKFFNSRILYDKISLGLDYYFNKKPVAVNWWFNDIGAPREYVAVLILLKGHMDNNLLLKYSEFVSDNTDNPAQYGANRTWVSEILIYKGCIKNNFSEIKKGFSAIASTLKIESEQGVEGIKIDNSFHQHRAQLYSGGYGMAFAEGIASFMALSAQTPFASEFTSEKRQLFSDMLLNGHQSFGFRNAIDFGSIGRTISRPNAIANIDPSVLSFMISSDPEHADDYKAWKSHIEGAAFPQKFQGNKYFWKSEIMTQHGANYYLSAKVISTRTTGTEMLNKENLKGYYLPLGATNIMTTGNEYRNIAPVWDWTRIPGTTSVRNPSSSILSWYLFGSNSFAGGVSNSKNGLIAYEHYYNGIQAQKAYFFIGNAMFCLGSGISAFPTQSVVTSVNQCLLNGAVDIGFADQSQLFSDSSRVFTNLQWVYHDNVGYYFPQGGEIALQQVTQSGTWKAINDEADDAIVSRKVFNLWINHGNVPKNEQYCYAVLPGKTLDQFKQEVQNSGFVVERNDKEIQAVLDEKQHCYAVVFYKSGTVSMSDGLQITSSKPALVLIEKQQNRYSISVADPTYEQTNLTLSLNRKVSGQEVSYINNTSVLKIFFPSDPLAGSTVTSSYIIEN